MPRRAVSMLCLETMTPPLCTTRASFNRSTSIVSPSEIPHLKSNGNRWVLPIPDGIMFLHQSGEPRDCSSALQMPGNQWWNLTFAQVLYFSKVLWYLYFIWVFLLSNTLLHSPSTPLQLRGQYCTLLYYIYFYSFSYSLQVQLDDMKHNQPINWCIIINKATSSI